MTIVREKKLAMSKVNLLICVDDRHKEQILEVVKALQASGLKIEIVMEQTGVITGSIDSTQVEGITRIEGVVAVEVEQKFQLEPPESEIQ
jgi:histidinol phosphatase-like enzyme